MYRKAKNIDFLRHKKSNQCNYEIQTNDTNI